MKTIRAVAFRSGDWWVAQCLEYRIATQSRRLEDLPYELDRLLKVQVAASLEMGIEPFQGFSPAPKKYWEMYAKAASSGVEPVRGGGQEGPQFETRIAA
ncbi:MAG TPA: hypothetical protein VGS22_27425 [Thermoanaerobaculia bacterium]|jgi:hypothetical protein|nr:hypothetical protein [Thermoanaerobaculia bacterium]